MDFGAGANLGEMRTGRDRLRVESTSKTRKMGTGGVCKGDFPAKPGARSPWMQGIALERSLGVGAVGRAAFRMHYRDKSAFLS